MAAPGKPPQQRRALSAPGGPVTATGDRAIAALLGRALGVSADEDPRLATHGFHSYPARFHPLLVRQLLADLPAGKTVLDPFVGSGTTLVEAALRGARGLGVDVNPLAVELAQLKATPLSAERIALLRNRAHAVAERSADRVKRRARTADSGARYDDPKAYAPHVFRELVGLREEIGAEKDEALRRMLLLVLSAIVVKVSRQPADTAAGTVERALGKGFATRIFDRKADELAARLSDFAAQVPPGTPAPDVRLGDARALTHVPAASVDVIVTSPPYLGTYDYAQQHARRFGRLGLDPRPFEEQEIGATPRQDARRRARQVAGRRGRVRRRVRARARARGPRVRGDRRLRGRQAGDPRRRRHPPRGGALQAGRPRRGSAGPPELLPARRAEDPPRAPAPAHPLSYMSLQTLVVQPTPPQQCCGETQIGPGHWPPQVSAWRQPSH